MPQRVALFIDWQNALIGARNLYHSRRGSRLPTDGQFDPVQLGELICQRAGGGEDRQLSQVRVYCGLADRRLDPKTHQARSRQAAAWRMAGATTVMRPLQYLRDRETGFRRAREKGIDVAIAVDFVTMAVRGIYDVGVLFSADTDLRPALEYVAYFHPEVRVETVAWRADGRSRPLTFDSPYSTWCHQLDEVDYDRVRDLTDYRPAR